MIDIDKLTIGEVKQLQGLLAGGASAARPLENKRVVLVVDRGWIFAGDQERTSDGYVRLRNALHVFRWSEIGFAKMLENPKSEKVDLRPCADVEVPEDAVVFRVPVSEAWGK